MLDDAEWLDPWSADAVGQLVSTRSAVVVGTAAAGVALPQGLRRLVDGGELTPVTLEPLDRTGVVDAVTGMLGGAPAHATGELLWRWSGGVPRMLDRIVRLGEDDGRLRPIDGRWWWIGSHPCDAATQAWDRWHHLRHDPALAPALDLLAMAGALPVTTIETLVGSDALALLERHDVVVVEAGTEPLRVRWRDGLAASARTWSS